MKQGLIGLIGGVGLATAVYLGVSGYQSHVNSPEYLRGRELDGKASYIMPEWNKLQTFDIDGKKVEVSNIGRDSPYRRLMLTVNNKIKLMSGYSASSSGWRRKLDVLELRLNDGNEWLTLTNNNIKDYEYWQAIYETLIGKIAEEKAEILNENIEEAKLDLKGIVQ